MFAGGRILARVVHAPVRGLFSAALASAFLLTGLRGVAAAEVIVPAWLGSDTLAAEPVVIPPPQGLADSLAALREAGRGVDYLWVLRDALIAPASIDSVVGRARRMGVRGLLVQVVGRGDAWYRSSVLPRAEPLGAASDADPLQHVIERGHAAGLEVHAWINCMLVWSGRRPPRDPRHIVRAHPDWIAELKDGRRTSWLTARGRHRLHLEGTYLAAARPGVRRWVQSVAAEIASRYPVDGIHLDYIRQPDIEVGYDPDTRARFALRYGADPARFEQHNPARRVALRQSWRDFQRDQVTAIVRAVRDTLNAIRPGIMLSAAVVADTARAEGPPAQSWRSWLRGGTIDRAYVMCYSPDIQTVMDQLAQIEGDLGASGRVVPGIAVYNTSPVTAAVKLKGARALGYPLLALYSYDSLFTTDRGWARLAEGLGDSPPATDDNP